MAATEEPTSNGQSNLFEEPPPSPATPLLGIGSLVRDDEAYLNIEEQRQREPFEQTYNCLEEAGKLFHIALPSMLMQFSLFSIFPASASEVGRLLGNLPFGGFSLGVLVGNLTCLSIMEGSLSACDTLMPRAFGSENYREVGRLAVRAVAVGVTLLLPPILPLVFCADTILVWLGQDPEASLLAQDWIRIYVAGVLPNLLFRVGIRFLLAQNKPWPLVFSSVTSCLLVHPIISHYMVLTMGLRGSALGIVLTQWLMLLFLRAYLFFWPVHVEETWPTVVSLRFLGESLEPRKLLRYARLALGGVLSLSEWWSWEINCFIAGSFGVVSLLAHTIAYNIIPLLYMLPLGIMLALTVRMGNVIVTDPKRAQLIATSTMTFVMVLATVMSCGLYLCRKPVIRVFTSDTQVTEMCLRIWPFICLYVFLLYISGCNNAILRALGMQWRFGTISTIFLYGLTLPAVVYFAMFRGGGLYAEWATMPVFYFCMQIVLVYLYITLDWEQYSASIRERVEMQSPRQVQSNETTALMA